MKRILTFVGIVLTLDFMALLLWFISGQPLPEGWFYAGSISAHIIRLFL